MPSAVTLSTDRAVVLTVSVPSHVTRCSAIATKRLWHADCCWYSGSYLQFLSEWNTSRCYVEGRKCCGRNRSVLVAVHSVIAGCISFRAVSCSHGTVPPWCPTDQITGCELVRGWRGKVWSWHALRTLHESFSVLFKKCGHLMKLWMYCQHSKCFWNRYSAAWLLGGESNSDQFLPIAATVECWRGQLASDVVNVLWLLARISPSVSQRPSFYKVILTYITRHEIQSDRNNIWSVLLNIVSL